MIRYYITRDDIIFSEKNEQEQEVLEAQGFIGYDSWQEAYESINKIKEINNG